jgi:hypothetical protein
MGAMGGPMARRLVHLGFSVTGYDVSAKRIETAATEGVTIAGSAAAAAEDADVVMSSLSNPAAVRAAYLDASGAAAQGLDTLDMAGVTTLYERWAGVKVRTKRDGPPVCSTAREVLAMRSRAATRTARRVAGRARQFAFRPHRRLEDRERVLAGKNVEQIKKVFETSRGV